VQVTRGSGVAFLQRAEGGQDQFGKRSGIGRTEPVKAAHHRTEEAEVGSAEQSYLCRRAGSRSGCPYARAANHAKEGDDLGDTPDIRDLRIMVAH
jgi:hypothetical protein